MPRGGHGPAAHLAGQFQEPCGIARQPPVRVAHGQLQQGLPGILAPHRRGEACRGGLAPGASVPGSLTPRREVSLGQHEMVERVELEQLRQRGRRAGLVPRQPRRDRQHLARRNAPPVVVESQPRVAARLGQVPAVERQFRQPNPGRGPEGHRPGGPAERIVRVGAAPQGTVQVPGQEVGLRIVGVEPERAPRMHEAFLVAGRPQRQRAHAEQRLPVPRFGCERPVVERSSFRVAPAARQFPRFEHETIRLREGSPGLGVGSKRAGHRAIPVEPANAAETGLARVRTALQTESGQRNPPRAVGRDLDLDHYRLKGCERDRARRNLLTT